MPIEILPDDVPFYTAIGVTSTLWAHLEASLDFSILIIFNKVGRSGHNKLPRSLSSKLDFLSHSAKGLPALATFADRIHESCAKISKSSESRHDLVHGFITGTMRPSGVTQMVRLLYGTTTHKEKVFNVTPAQILQHAEEVNSLATAHLELTDELRRAFGM